MTHCKDSDDLKTANSRSVRSAKKAEQEAAHAERDRQLALTQEMLTVVALHETPCAVRKFTVFKGERVEIRLYRVLRAHGGICLIKCFIGKQKPVISVEGFETLQKRYEAPHTPFQYAWLETLADLERVRLQAYDTERQRREDLPHHGHESGE